MAARPSVKATWPAVGMVLIAVLGAAAQVQVSRPKLSEPGHVWMELGFRHPEYPVEMLVASGLAYALLRLGRRRIRIA